MARKDTTLFDMLSAIDSGDYKSYEKFEDEFNPFMTMKWMAACKDPIRITRVNELLNVVVFALHDHKQLLYNLSCALTDGDTKRYKWISRQKNVDTVKVELVSEYFDISPREARTSIGLYDTDDFIEMAEEMGYNDKELKSLKKKINDT